MKDLSDKCIAGGTLDDLIQFYKQNGNSSSVELGNTCIELINASTKTQKTALFLVDNTKSYVALKCHSLKEFVEKHTSLTYDAAVKQLEAARIAVQHFGFEFINYFSDASLRTLMQIQNFNVREQVIEKICSDNKVDRSNLTKKMFTAEKVMRATNKVTGRPFFSKQYRINKMTRDVYDRNYTSSNPVHVNEPVQVYNSPEYHAQREEDDLDDTVINLHVNYNDIYFKERVYYTYSPLELREIIKRDFPDFYSEHLKDKFLNQAEYVYVLYGFGCLNLSADEVLSPLQQKWQSKLFSDETEAREYLCKLDANALIIFMNVLDSFSFSHRYTKLSNPLTNLDDFTKEQLIETIIYGYKSIWCSEDSSYDYEEDEEENDEDDDEDDEDDDEENADDREDDDDDGEDDDDKGEDEDSALAIELNDVSEKTLSNEEAEIISSTISNKPYYDPSDSNIEENLIPDELKKIGTEIVKCAYSCQESLSAKKALILGLTLKLEETELYFAFKCIQEAIKSSRSQ